MANEIPTLTTTITGPMRTAQAGLTSRFMLTSRLFPAVYTEPSANATSVKVPYMPVPSPVSAHGTETNAVTKGAISVTYTTLTPTQFPSITSVSKLAIQGGNGVPGIVQNVMINDVASGVDKYIASIATTDNFTADPIADCITVAKFEAAIVDLYDTGYVGQPIAIMSNRMFTKIKQDNRTAYTPRANDEFLAMGLNKMGYQGELCGVPVITLPKSWLPEATINGATVTNGILMFREYGIGVGYQIGVDPTASTIVHLTEVPAHNNHEYGATAYLGAAKISASGGIILGSDIEEN